MDEVGETGRFDGSKPIALMTLFGTLRICRADGSEIAISNRRAKALLGMLALCPDHPIEREVLSRLLWPGRFGAHAKASLRQCLLDLKKLLEPVGADPIEATRNTVGLNRAMIATDLLDLERTLASRDCAAAARQLRAIGSAQLLAEMDFGAAFNLWLAAQRDAVANRLEQAVDVALEAALRDRDMAGHDALLAAWSARHPGVQPPPPRPAADTRTRVAVLPFKALGAPDEQDYFADGLVDELITALGQVPQMLVAGRTSSFHFRDSALAAPAIAEALRVGYLIEGSVQRQGERVRVFARLVDGADGFERWAQRYDGSLDDIFALQEQVAQAVSAALGQAIGLKFAAPQVRGSTASKEAYDLYMQGRAVGSRIFGAGVLDQAIDLLERAVELDPNFAEGWVELAEAHHNVSVYTQCLDRNAAALRMAECAERAAMLAPQLGYSRALLATYEWTRKNVLRALDLMFEAYRIEPESPAIAMRLGSFLLYCGRIDDAAPYVLAAIDKDPVDARKYALLWAVHMGRGEIAQAQAAGQRMVDLGWPSVHLAVATAALGLHEQAIEQYRLTQRLVNTMILPPAGAQATSAEAMDAYWLIAAKGVCSGVEVDRLMYWQVLEMMFATLHDPSDQAIVAPAIFTGNAELVFRAYDRQITPANLLSLITLWADIDPIRRVREHPEFIPFAQRIGMAAAWDKYGWPDLLPPPDNLPRLN